MGLNSLGDMAQSFMLRRFTTSMKQSATIAAQELTTGYTASIGKMLGGDLTTYAALEASLSRLIAYGGTTQLAASTATAMQVVLGQIDTQTAGLGTQLLDAVNSGAPNRMDGLLGDISQRFEAVLASLNTKIGDRTIFAGVSSDGAAVSSSQTILSALEATLVGLGAVTASEVETAVNAWFADPSGFAAVGYLGGVATAAVAISAEDSVDLGFTAQDPAILDTLKSLAMIALVDRGAVGGDADLKHQVVGLAATSLLQNDTDRAFLRGNLGFAQARIEQAQTRNESEIAALEIARSDLLSIDPYEAATRLEAAQTQLETLYSVTARLSRLRLVDFLR
jgi:flagellar hook-associated protein 3 FlgL